MHRKTVESLRTVPVRVFATIYSDMRREAGDTDEDPSSRLDSSEARADSLPPGVSAIPETQATQQDPPPTTDDQGQPVNRNRVEQPTNGATPEVPPQEVRQPDTESTVSVSYTYYSEEVDISVLNVRVPHQEVSTMLELDPREMADGLSSYGSLEKLYEGSLIIIMKVKTRDNVECIIKEYNSGEMKEKMKSLLLRKLGDKTEALTVQVDLKHLQKLKSFFGRECIGGSITFTFCEEREHWFWSPADNTHWQSCDILTVGGGVLGGKRPRDTDLARLLKLADINREKLKAEHPKPCYLCHESMDHTVGSSEFERDIFSVPIKVSWPSEETQTPSRSWFLQSTLLTPDEKHKIQSIPSTSEYILDLFRDVFMRTENYVDTSLYNI